MIILSNKEKNFYEKLEKFLEKRLNEDSKNVDQKVKKIILDVKKNKDRALVKYTKKFDNFKLNKNNILLSQKIINQNIKILNKEIMASFKLSIKNLRKFHLKQFPKNFKLTDKNFLTGSFWKPIDSVGLYVPGGKSSYPSSLIMNAVPAIVAGVKRIVVATPSTNGITNPYITSLCNFLKINEIYQIGGAQAISAMTYGTETIKPVNKIFGPGNSFVASAKKQVFGKVGIDLIAGPSEIVVVADKNENPEWIASDLIAQAEHDEKSQTILIVDNIFFAKKIRELIKKLSNNLSKKSIIKKSIKNHSAIIVTDNLLSANKIINFIAPEHLHLQGKKSEKLFNKIHNAGCIFIGAYSSEAFGDYIAGTNHVLPTLGTSKFSSGLSVLDFMKRTSHVKVKKNDYDYMAKHVVNMSNSEGLTGHSLSVKIRQKVEKKI